MVLIFYLDGVTLAENAVSDTNKLAIKRKIEEDDILFRPNI